ncbi:acetyl-CoA hydrolase/transferase family protein [Rufibacter glacialis]|uniref:Acetyl-CoA hydrolase/transferase family protein n=1 Tax=Rufibacter glacialis TaxID=1259555 RepID=A0A5M8QN63_9BACT|nr:acetyl-CoA hydrolase/transferase C-terminal domain-containing protein [Rufibacter glacialis]KAA6437575.1 acetyl-CoA hydrolase/transferase family protein [Rufibacter glacialis]GGK58187.1 4-hydroxybutyrate CoA-transferase [Rufibacter glacialis]
MSHLPDYTTPEEAVKLIKSGDRVFVHGAAMTPLRLVNAVSARASELREVEFIHMHTEGPAPYTYPENAGSFKTNACFVGGNIRQALKEGTADYIPIFLSEISLLFRRNILPLDVALVQVSPPDAHGFCSLGASVDVTLSAVETAKILIAEVNPRVPRSHGDGVVHISKFHAKVAVDEPLPEHTNKPAGEVETKIGQLVASLVEDGATLQMGIGGIPDAVLAQLGNHKDLGIHTEMFSDGIIPLVEKGVITGARKKVLKHKIVSCFVNGSQKVFDFLHDNPAVVMKETVFTNDTAIIRQNPKTTAINSAIEVDLTGQVCADSIGMYQFSGVGGQMDFMRGAALSEGGKPIIALPSITNKGESKIVNILKPGASVTTTRAHVRYIVTEFGIADLYGKNLRQRAKELIQIAHPTHQEELERLAFDRFKVL